MSRPVIAAAMTVAAMLALSPASHAQEWNATGLTPIMYMPLHTINSTRYYSI